MTQVLPRNDSAPPDDAGLQHALHVGPAGQLAVGRHGSILLQLLELTATATATATTLSLSLSVWVKRDIDKTIR